ncbi:GntR family transcriptional regulator [Vibrio mediterranei]|uniref:GntR family transcriptional regulator n=1 Tax=Vibrio mediterranei TaxID=689 RepID=UPI004068CE14
MSNTKQRAKERLKADILNYQFPPGQRLKVDDLAKLYQVGLSPMREAIMALSSEGFVDYKTHLGGFVSNVTWQEFSESVAVAKFLYAQLLQQSEASVSTGGRQKAKVLHYELSVALRNYPLTVSHIDRIEKLFLRYLMTLVDHEPKTISHQLLETTLGVLARYRRLHFLKTGNYGCMIDLNALSKLPGCLRMSDKTQTSKIIAQSIQANPQEIEHVFGLVHP